jgi:hypothetical protein
MSNNHINLKPWGLVKFMDSYSSGKVASKVTRKVVIVGAGLAGLVCARHLHRQGIKPLIIEKSRGLGGRMATRRRDRVCFDHGLPGIAIADSPSPSQIPSQSLIHELLAQKIIQPGLTAWAQWSPTQGISSQSPQQIYVAPEGMSAIAKYLAQDLVIKREWLLQSLLPTEKGYWQLTNSQGEILQAEAIILTVPAPQAVAILERSGLELFSGDLISQLKSITYEPKLVLMAGYSPELASELNFSWQGIEFTQHPTLSKIILDSHKRLVPEYPVYVMHSTPDFAHKFDLREDLSDVISIILQNAHDLLHPAFTQPQWSQIHRWRYAIPQFSLNSDFLWAERSLPLLFCGDGYGAHQDSTLQPIERAILSGLSAANALLTTASF